MTRLIDARTSMGMAETDLSGDLFPLSTPVLIGQVGLNVPGTTPGIIRVQFDGVAGIQLPTSPVLEATVTLTVVNGVLSTDPVVYQSLSTYDTVVESSNFKLIPLMAAAYNVPAPVSGLLIYSLYMTVGAVAPVLRSGPECFNVSAYTDG
ncbi:MAG: hypothetical protein K0R57_3843 [Paenibacillaceae bacterium]|nr:hypothetical protein [Paenibacillaceae bacterium]